MDRVGAGSLLEHVGGQCLRPYVLGRSQDLVELASDCNVVALDHLKVPLLFGSVMDELGPDLGVLNRQTRRRSCDPSGSFHHLLAKVPQQTPVILEGCPSRFDSVHNRDCGELALELRPDESQLLDQPAAAGVGLFVDGVIRPDTGEVSERDHEPA